MLNVKRMADEIRVYREAEQKRRVPAAVLARDRHRAKKPARSGCSGINGWPRA